MSGSQTSSGHRVAIIGGGFIAWLLWLGIHITYLMITGQSLLPDIEAPEPPA